MRKQTFTFSAQGFTLIELMIVIVIMAILIAIAAPSFEEVTKRNNVEALQSKIASSVAAARTEAASRNTVVTICSRDTATSNSTCGANDDWNFGWIVFEDADSDGVIDASEEVIDVYQHYNDYTVSATAAAAISSLSFNSQGFMTTTTAAVFTACDPEKENIGTSTSPIYLYARGLMVNPSGLVVKSQASTDSNHKNAHLNPSNTAALLACP